jgi:CubicO group peptidase (beta-lactamase class C family)
MTHSVYLDAKLEDHVQAYNKLKRQGMRLRSIGMFGKPSDARYCAVWTHSADTTSWGAYWGQNADGRAAARAGYLQLGFVPTMVAATGFPGEQPIFSEVFIRPAGWQQNPDKTTWSRARTRFDLLTGGSVDIPQGAQAVPQPGAAHGFTQAIEKWSKKNYYLQWMAPYVGSDGSLRCAAVFRRRRFSRLLGYGYDVRTLTDDFEGATRAFQEVHYRPQVLATDAVGSQHMIWLDEPIGEWKLARGLSSSEAESLILQLAGSVSGTKAGRPRLVPARITAVQGLGSGTRRGPLGQVAGFTHQPGDSEGHVVRLPSGRPVTIPPAAGYDICFFQEAMPSRKRHFWPSGPMPTSPDAVAATQAFDDYMRGFMAHFNIRSTQLSVFYRNKQVVVRAYTWAEPGYHGGNTTKLDAPQHFQPTDVTTPMRVGSVSKIITATAAMILGEKGLFHFGSPVPSPTGVTGPLGTPLDSIVQFGTSGAIANGPLRSVTMGEILTHRSGLREGPTYCQQPTATAAATHTQLPNTVKDVLEFMSGDATAAGFADPNGNPDSPGDERQYSNDNFFLAGEAVRVLFNTTTSTRARTQYEAVRRLIFDKLDCPGAREGVASPSVPLADDEPWYYPGAAAVTDSTLVEGALAESTYNWNMNTVSGAGGWAVPAVELARMFASMNRHGTLFEHPIPVVTPLGLAGSTPDEFMYTPWAPVNGADGQYGGGDQAIGYLVDTMPTEVIPVSPMSPAPPPPFGALVPTVWHNGQITGGGAFVFRRRDDAKHGTGAALIMNWGGGLPGFVLDPHAQSFAALGPSFPGQDLNELIIAHTPAFANMTDLAPQIYAGWSPW